jgi:hypothetical protein
MPHDRLRALGIVHPLRKQRSSEGRDDRNDPDTDSSDEPEIVSAVAAGNDAIEIPIPSFSNSDVMQINEPPECALETSSRPPNLIPWSGASQTSGSW